MSPSVSTTVAFCVFLAATLLFAACPTAEAARSSAKLDMSAAPAAGSKVAANNAQLHDIPAVFAFGDSTLDPGNNNRLNTVVRADHLPYGRAFPGGGEPTGRFSDGKLITDYIVAALGIKDLLPAYHAEGLSLANASTGVSFASAGSGLDDLTSQNALVSTFSSQIADFQQLLSRIGSPNADAIAAKSLFILSDGTNDVTLNYYLPIPIRALNFPTIDQYHDYLISCFQAYIKALYQLGARRFIVAGMPPVGCLPVQKTLGMMQPPLGSGGCVEEQNADTRRYNDKLQKMLAALEAESDGASMAYSDAYGPMADMVEHPQKYGFTQTGRGCCGTGMLEMGALCTSTMLQCKSPEQYMFFDSVHPTQAAYKAMADQIIKSHISQFTNN